MESLAKASALALAMEQRGPQEVLDKLGANATGLPFNSGLAVELTQGASRTCQVNAGAMSTVSLIAAKDKTDRWKQHSQQPSAPGPTALSVNEPVFQLEWTNQHNQALAMLGMVWSLLW